MLEYDKFRKLWEQVEEELDEKQGVPSDVDPAKWERCVKDVKKDSDVDNPYAVCNASLSEEEEDYEEMEESKSKKRNKKKAGHDSQGRVISINQATGEREPIGKHGKTHIPNKKDKLNTRKARKDADRKEIRKYYEGVSQDELMDLMKYIKENRQLVMDVIDFIDKQD